MVLSTASFITQIAVLVLVLVLLHKPLGLYMARPFSRNQHAKVERALYRLAGVDSGTEQSLPVYLRSVLLFSLISILAIFALQRLQAVLPGSNSLPGVGPWVAMNTAISFVTNTNWQTYAPGATVGIFVQMCLLAVQNFLSAAVGIVVVVVALIRGIVRTTTDRLGNFWVDLTRASFRILLPIATVAAIALATNRVMIRRGITLGALPAAVWLLGDRDERGVARLQRVANRRLHVPRASNRPRSASRPVPPEKQCIPSSEASKRVPGVPGGPRTAIQPPPVTQQQKHFWASPGPGGQRWR